MIWDTDVRIVAMITGLVENGKAKCARYWPENIGESLCFAEAAGTIKVELVSVEDPLPQFKKSILRVTREGVTKDIVHAWWHSWPDRGVPDSIAGINEYIHLLREGRTTSAPSLVHCSAGIGRTGTFICIDIGMRQVGRKCTKSWQVPSACRL